MRYKVDDEVIMSPNILEHQDFISITGRKFSPTPSMLKPKILSIKSVYEDCYLCSDGYYYAEDWLLPVPIFKIGDKTKMRINYKKKEVLSQEESSTQDVQYAVESAKLQLASDILATKKSIQSIEVKLQEAKTEYPLDTQKIVDLKTTLESFQKGLKSLEELKDELGL